MYYVLEVSIQENLQIEFTQNEKHFLRDLYINATMAKFHVVKFFILKFTDSNVDYKN